MTGRSVTRLIDCFERGIYLRPWAKMILYNNMRIFVKGNIGKITEMQEEHKNMGAWSYVQPRTQTAVGGYHR